MILRIPAPTDPVTSIRVEYCLLEWNDQDRSTRWTVEVSGDLTDWVAVPGLGAVTEAAAATEPAWTARDLTATLSAPELPELSTYLYLRFSAADEGGSGGRDECAIDDIRIVISYG